MNKSILVGLAILAVSSSAASAWTNRHHSRATTPKASAAVINPDARTRNAYAAMRTPLAVAPGVSSKNHDMYIKNLRESGYDPKQDFDAGGNVRTK
jgi:hypothetical protein